MGLNCIITNTFVGWGFTLGRPFKYRKILLPNWSIKLTPAKNTWIFLHWVWIIWKHIHWLIHLVVVFWQKFLKFVLFRRCGSTSSLRDKILLIWILDFISVVNLAILFNLFRIVIHKLADSWKIAIALWPWFFQPYLLMGIALVLLEKDIALIFYTVTLIRAAISFVIKIHFCFLR